MGDSLEDQANRNRVYQNWTKCLTWNKVQKSQMEQDQNVVITFEAISGLLLVLSMGLIGAMIIIFVELAVKAFNGNNDKY